MDGRTAGLPFSRGDDLCVDPGGRPAGRRAAHAGGGGRVRCAAHCHPGLQRPRADRIPPSSPSRTHPRLRCSGRAPTRSTVAFSGGACSWCRAGANAPRKRRLAQPGAHCEWHSRGHGFDPGSGFPDLVQCPVVLPWAASSAGRAPGSQSGGREFDPRAVHQIRQRLSRLPKSAERRICLFLVDSRSPRAALNLPCRSTRHARSTDRSGRLQTPAPGARRPTADRRRARSRPPRIPRPRDASSIPC